MNIWNIIIKQQEKDTFDVDIPSTEMKLIINTGQHDGQLSMLSSNVFKEIKQHNLVLKTNVSDLLHLALGVYTADQVVSRAEQGFQGWSRHFRLYVPVSSLKEWNSSQKNLIDILSFLSGDKWEVYFRKNEINETKSGELFTKPNPYSTQQVSLFSGGLDSFIGAVDLLEGKQKVAFVSHYKRGSEGSVQTKLYAKLKENYGEDSFVQYQFYVQPNQHHKDAKKEGSSRARSFLFMCLGISVANSLDEHANFIIPENGLISLNVPLTGTRVGSHSTRTTHPYYLRIFKEIIATIGIKNPIFNPYQFRTKGEMIMECKEQSVLKRLGPETLSCSHSENSRYAGLSPGIHCGYCVPCIIRQAAEIKSNLFSTRYVYSVLKSPPPQTRKSGSDIRAFKLALERMKDKSKRSLMFDVLSSGPVPTDDYEEFAKYIDVYERGMKEVRTFLLKKDEIS
jgi:7-cyano-7-deazaguanine synthase in queuosine biosynthesis